MNHGPSGLNPELDAHVRASKGDFNPTQMGDGARRKPLPPVTIGPAVKQQIAVVQPETD